MKTLFSDNRPFIRYRDERNSYGRIRVKNGLGSSKYSHARYIDLAPNELQFNEHARGSWIERLRFPLNEINYSAPSIPTDTFDRTYIYIPAEYNSPFLVNLTMRDSDLFKCR